MIYLIVSIVLLIIILFQYFNQLKVSSNTILGFIGSNGTGKTFSAVYRGVIEFKKQRIKYFVYKIFPLIGWFCPTWTYVPNVYSTIPIRLRKRGKYQFSRVFTKEHFLRQKLLPEGTIVVLDELGQLASQWDYDNPFVREQLADFARFYRHWIDGRLFVTDQSIDNIVKVIRCRLGVVYYLNNFRRFYMLPFYKVDVTPLLMIEDSQQQISIVSQDKSYFFGFLHYRWFQKLFKLKRYDSRCYSEIYKHGAIREPIPFDSTLKTRYLIDISVCKKQSRDYQDNRQKYKEALFTSSDDLKARNLHTSYSAAKPQENKEE